MWNMGNYNCNIWGWIEEGVILIFIFNANLFKKEFYNRHIFRNISTVKYIELNELMIKRDNTKNKIPKKVTEEEISLICFKNT